MTSSRHQGCSWYLLLVGQDIHFSSLINVVARLQSSRSRLDDLLTWLRSLKDLVSIAVACLLVTWGWCQCDLMRYDKTHKTQEGDRIELSGPNVSQLSLGHWKELILVFIYCLHLMFMVSLNYFERVMVSFRYERFQVYCINSLHLILRWTEIILLWPQQSGAHLSALSADHQKSWRYKLDGSVLVGAQSTLTPTWRPLSPSQMLEGGIRSDSIELLSRHSSVPRSLVGSL